jgi:hypothetical protein
VRLQRHSKESSRNHYLGYMMSKNNEVNMPKETERKFFICYSLYAWCCPFAILIVSVIFDFMPVIPSSYLKPNFGNNKCWFSSKWHDFVLVRKLFEAEEIICVTYVQNIFCHRTQHCRAGNKDIIHSTVTSLTIKNTLCAY